MNKSDIIEICVAVAYVAMIPVVFFVLFNETYFTLGIMLVLALIIRMGKFNIVGICAMVAYLTTILTSIIIPTNSYIVINGIAFTIPLIIRRNKSSTIGICGALIYIILMMVTFFVFDKPWDFFVEMALAFPFSIIAFGLFAKIDYLMRDLGGEWFLSLTANIIWIYFLTRFIYWIVKAANSPHPDMDEDGPEDRTR